jgi:hypothetical protein
MMSDPSAASGFFVLRARWWGFSSARLPDGTGGGAGEASCIELWARPRFGGFAAAGDSTAQRLPSSASASALLRLLAGRGRAAAAAWGAAAFYAAAAAYNFFIARA